MTKRILLLLFLVHSVLYAGAQTLTTFHRGYFDTLTYSSPFGGGNPIGSSLAEVPGGDFLAALTYGIMRTDNVGKPKWVMSYSAPGAVPGPGFPNARQAVFYQVLPLASGDAIALGALKSPSISSQPDTTIICRISASGSIVWAKTVVAPAPQSLQPRGATLTANGELLVCLYSNFSPSVVGDYTVMMRMSLTGSVIWQRYLINNSTAPANRQFRSWDAAECSNGDFLVSGFGNVPDSNLIARFNSTGQLRWVKSYQCGAMTRRAFQRVRELPGGSIGVAIGDVYPRYSGGYVVLDSLGNLGTVQKAYKDSFYYGNAMIAANGDMAFITRNLMYKVNMAGSLVFAHHYTPPTATQTLQALCNTADGGYALGGSYLPGSTSTFISRGYMVKTDASGASLPYSDNFTLADTPCNCRMTVTNITDTALNFPVSNLTLASSAILMHDTLFALTLDVPLHAAPGSIVAYPNPLRDELYFSGTAGVVNAALYASDGRLVLAERATKSLHVGTLPAGVYFLLLKDDKGKQLSLQRLIKE